VSVSVSGIGWFWFMVGVLWYALLIGAAALVFG